jgi:hypothetical protein
MVHLVHPDSNQQPNILSTSRWSYGLWPQGRETVRNKRPEKCLLQESTWPRSATAGQLQAGPPRIASLQNWQGALGLTFRGCAKPSETRFLKKGTRSLKTTSCACSAYCRAWMRCASQGQIGQSQSAQSQGARSSTSNGCTRC